MNPTSHEGATQTKSPPQEPVIVQLDPKWYTPFIRLSTAKPLLTSWIRLSLHSALKEFFEPLRSNDPRADFFAVYRKESDEFDRDYARKYDEDLNTSLIFVSESIRTCSPSTDSGRCSGGFILCSQLSVHNRCPIAAGTGSECDDRRLYANPDPRSERFTFPRHRP